MELASCEFFGRVEDVIAKPIDTGKSNLAIALAVGEPPADACRFTRDPGSGWLTGRDKLGRKGWCRVQRLLSHRSLRIPAAAMLMRNPDDA